MKEVCKYKIEYLFQDNLLEHLFKNNKTCLNDITKDDFIEYFLTNDILYKDAHVLLNYYEELKNNFSFNKCKTCNQKKKHISYIKDSLFDINSLELNQSLITNLSITDYNRQLELEEYNYLIKNIKEVNYDLDLKYIIPKSIKSIVYDFELVKVSDLINLTYIEYMSIKKEDIKKFNIFLERLTSDYLASLQHDFLSLITANDNRKNIILAKRSSHQKLKDIANELNLSVQWVLQLEQEIINDFYNLIVKKEFKLYKILVDTEFSKELALQYFGETHEIFEYLYNKTRAV